MARAGAGAVDQVPVNAAVLPVPLGVAPAPVLLGAVGEWEVDVRSNEQAAESAPARRSVRDQTRTITNHQGRRGAENVELGRSRFSTPTTTLDARQYEYDGPP
jgi:hypothetical protein